MPSTSSASIYRTLLWSVLRTLWATVGPDGLLSHMLNANWPEKFRQDAAKSVNKELRRELRLFSDDCSLQYLEIGCTEGYVDSLAAKTHGLDSINTALRSEKYELQRLESI